MAKKKDQTAAAAGERVVVYKRARWKHWLRWFGVTILFLLNISLIGSLIESFRSASLVSVHSQIATVIIVLFFDITILTPVLLECDSVSVTPEYIILQALLWKEKVKWRDIVSFKDPIYLRFAILRTRRLVYLLSRRDLEPFVQLLATIQFQQAKVVK